MSHAALAPEARRTIEQARILDCGEMLLWEKEDVLTRMIVSVGGYRENESRI